MVRALDSGTERVRALVGDIALCSWARHFTLTAPLSTLFYNRRQPCDELASHSGGSRNTPSHFMLQKPE